MSNILQTRSPRSTKEPVSHLHVVVPVSAHRQARIAAVKSGMSFKLYIARLLLSAEPISDTALEAPTKPSTDAAQGIITEADQG